MTTLLDLVDEGVLIGDVAVVADDVTLTYGELHGRADALAARLRSLGVGPESVVGVRMPRCAELVVALLGVLKAGGAYLPLDPEYPEERLRFMVEDSSAELVLTRDFVAETGTSGTPVDSGVGPGSAAYVIYTSGSTGRPKGVVVEHRAVVNRLRWAQAEYGLDASDRVLQKTPFGFDVSVWEFFWTLSAGATLVVAEPGGHRDPAYLARTIVERGVTTAHFVPSMLRAFLSQPLPTLPLRRVLCSGEALPDGLAESFHEAVGCELHNLYGPTEAAVDVTAVRCLPGQAITIGRPVSNTRIHVVDDDLTETDGQGELMIAGVQLARGYLGRPGLTAERFVPNPFAEAPGERLYRTGDLASWLPDGTIAYHGRIDHQVKLHGNRIELGEVETALLTHLDVRAAVAAVRDDRLVAYFVPAGEPPRGTELRAHLARTLPEAMLPTVWVPLDALPLTPSGKTDRNALPDPDGRRPDLAVPLVLPRDDAERAVAETWSAVLDVRPVGVHDPFLDLGGQSLAATRVCARLTEAFGRRVTVADLFAAPTVEALAKLVTVDLPAPEAVPAEDGLSAAQQRMWFLDQLSGPSSEYSMYEAYECVGGIDVEALRAAVVALGRRHASLRTTYRAERGVPRPEVDAQDLALTVVDGSAEEFLAREVARPFDLASGPLLRLSLVRTAPDRFVLVAVIHHITADDTSMAVLWRDLAALYRGEDLPALSPVAPERPDPAGVAYWRDRLAGAPPVLEVPGDLTRPAKRDQVVEGTEEFALPAEVVERLRARARAAGATDYMALLAAFALYLRRLTGRRDLVVATFTGNRSSVAAEDAIGLFVNTLPLRFDVPGEYPDVLSVVRDAVVGALRHQDTPFDRIVTAVRPPRDLTRNPVAQIAFQTLGSLADRLVLPGVAVTPWRVGQGGNPFDLMVTVRDAPDGVTGTLHYDRALYTEAAAAELARGFAGLVHEIAGGCDRPS